MPYLAMRDPFGSTYHVSTRSQETLQRWFDEWLPVLYPSDAPADYGDPVILWVYPLLSDDGKTPDWPADSRYMGDTFTIPRDPKRALETLGKRAEWIKSQEGKP